MFLKGRRTTRRVVMTRAYGCRFFLRTWLQIIWICTLLSPQKATGYVQIVPFTSTTLYGLCSKTSCTNEIQNICELSVVK